MNDQIPDQSPSMTGPTTDAPRWYVVGSMAWLRVVRFGLWCRVLSPRRALLLTAPWSQAAALAGLKLPARFFEIAAQAGLRLPGAPAPSQL